ncbi:MULTISPECIES: sulfotransferase family protein [Actibacterium]|uniref:Sulfotransferase domain-containing protein n=1 Tax=Actibacterium naphthalenivorans TaxID=1614693 RepID=A0A840CEM0_9RHOB|nr:MULTISPECIES: sulfotransferase family protein [Actibacterium]ALG91637.1 hypothetical protein TQ29_17365 [Actibacterium sp. EMB200-NS6]MBB4021729.1 hypothetical protein [Actibacterium naphthalenivorans]
MKKRIIIHIGYHKTGSTSLQSYMEENRDFLSKRGLYYPVTKRDHDRDYFNKHLKLFNDLIVIDHHDDEFFEKVATVFEPYLNEIEKSGCNLAVLSEESFSAFGPKMIEALGFLRKTYDVKILAVLRRQDEFLQSWYHQTIKDFREVRDFSQFLKDENWRRLRYDEALAHWAAAFGDENLIVRSYDLIKKEKTENILSFLLGEILGKHPDWTIEQRVWNSSFSSIGYEVLKYVSRQGMPEAEYRQLIQTLHAQIRRLPDVKTNPLFLRPYLDQDLCNVIYSWFYESNVRTAEKYFGSQNMFPGFSGSEIPPKVVKSFENKITFFPREVVTALVQLLLNNEPR